MPVLLAGCAFTSASLARSEAELEYISHVKSFPLTFTVPKEQGQDAWGRAQSFLGRFSSMKLQVVTDFVIQTYNPPRDWGFGLYYKSTKW